MVDGAILIIGVLFIMIFLIQLTNMITTGYLVKMKCNQSLSLVESSITEDIYNSLSEKDYEHYQSLVVDDAKSELKQKYEDLFFDKLHSTLNFDKKSGYYQGDYFRIKEDSVKLTAHSLEDGFIRMNVELDIEYMINAPLVGKVTFLTKGTKITSNYSFLNTINSDSNSDSVHGGQNEFEEKH